MGARVSKPVETTPPKPHTDDVFAERFLADAHHTLAQDRCGALAEMAKT